MGQIKTNKKLFYSLGGEYDQNNYNTSFHNITGIEKSVPGNFQRIKNFQYDAVSLKTLETICRKGKIRPQNIDLPGVNFTGLCYDGSIRLFPKDESDVHSNFRKYIEDGLSIIISKSILQSLPKQIAFAKDNETRINSNIPKAFFDAVGMPLGYEESLFEFHSLSDYYKAREREYYIIREMLSDSRIEIPVCDTITGEIIENRDDIKRLTKAFIK